MEVQENKILDFIAFYLNVPTFKEAVIKEWESLQ